MKRTLGHFLSLISIIAAMGLTAAAEQTTVVPQRPRGTAQQTPRDPAKAAKQVAEQSENLTNQPNRPKLNAQQQKNRRANAVVERYLGGLQKNVGLDDQQTRRLGARLGNYVRQQLMLADRRNEARSRLKELNDQKASDEEIQAQYKVLETTEAQQVNTKKRFYADVNPQLSVQQQANLKIYMDSTDQNVLQAIQKSRNN